MTRRESPTPAVGVGRGPGAPEAQGGLEPLGERQQPEDHPDPRQELIPPARATAARKRQSQARKPGQ